MIAKTPAAPPTSLHTRLQNAAKLANRQTNPTPAEAQADKLAKTPKTPTIVANKPVPVTPTKPIPITKTTTTDSTNVTNDSFITITHKKTQKNTTTNNKKTNNDKPNNKTTKKANKPKTSTTTTIDTTTTADNSPPIDDIESFTSTEDTQTSIDRTAFNILVQVLHPLDNAIPDGAMTTDRLHTILTTTLAHHLERIPLLLFSIKKILFIKSEKRTKPHQNQYAHYYRLILGPQATLDQFDNELFYEQCLAFALQHWHLRQNHQFTMSPGALHADQLLTPEVKNPPSSDFWAKQIHLLLPAVNNNDDKAQGCLLGIPPDTWGAGRRACLDLLEIIYYKLQPHFATTKLGASLNADYHTFLEFIGIRPAFLQTYGQKSNQRAPVFFICCYSGDAWTLILKAAQAAGPITIHGCSCILHPFPKPVDRPTFIQGANQLSQRIKEMVHLTTDRLRIRTISDEEDLIAQTPHAVAIIPRFVDHSPEAVCHTLVFLPTPETVSYTNDTLHQACIPPELLAPLPPPTYLSTATTALPKPHTDTSPDLLKAIFAQWNSPPDPTPPDDANAPSRKRPCASPEPPVIDLSQGDAEDSPIDLSKDTDEPHDDTTADPIDSSEDDEPPDDESTNSSTDMQNAESQTLLSDDHDELDDLDHAMSQSAAAEYKHLQFHVERHHPDRLAEFHILQTHFKTTNGDPSILGARIYSLDHI